MKNYVSVLLLCTISFSHCKGQVSPIGEEPLLLENFRFDTKISELYPDKNKSKKYEGYFEVMGTMRPQMVLKDSTYVNEFTTGKKAIGIEYRQQTSTSIDTMAMFGNQAFQKLNIATTPDGKIKIINAVAENLTAEQADEFIKRLINEYGTPRKLKSSWNDEFTIYQWSETKKIIRFVSAYNDESNSLKIAVDADKKTASPGKKEPHFVGYFYIINPAMQEDVFGKVKTGDFAYLGEKGK